MVRVRVRAIYGIRIRELTAFSAAARRALQAFTSACTVRARVIGELGSWLVCGAGLRGRTEIGGVRVGIGIGPPDLLGLGLGLDRLLKKRVLWNSNLEMSDSG